MAGTVPGFSLTPQFDKLGNVAPGAKLYVITAGTVSTPQNAYQDTGLTVLRPNPMIADATGRLPQWFVADGQIKLRLTDANGVELFVQDNLLVLGPSSGGGGGTTVDATTVLATGDMKLVYNTGTLSGFVRCNGRTIGNATSGATERANADTSALFVLLWGANASLAVSGGRGASAAADYAANKTIALPDFRGRAPFGLDDMGNSLAGRLTSTYAGVTPNVMGSSGGFEYQTLTLAQLPTGITSAGNVLVFPNGSAGVFYPVNSTGWTFASVTATGGGIIVPSSLAGATIVGGNTASGSNTLTSDNTGGTPHPIAPPMMLITIYIKL